MKIFNKNKYISYIIIFVFLVATVFGFIINYTVGILLFLPTGIFISIKVIELISIIKSKNKTNNNVSSNEISTSNNASTILASNDNNSQQWYYDQNTGLYYDSVSGYYYDANTGQYYMNNNSSIQTNQPTQQWYYDQNTGLYYDSVSGYYYDSNTGQYYMNNNSNNMYNNDDNMLNGLVEKGKEVRKIKVQAANSSISFDSSNDYLDNMKKNNIDNDELLNDGINKLEKETFEDEKEFKNNIDRGPEVEILDDFGNSNQVNNEEIEIINIGEEVKENNETPIEEGIETIEEIEGKKRKVLGKTEKNIIKKGLLLKREELSSLLCILIEKDRLPSNYRNTINKFLNEYIDKKYIKQTELSLLKTKLSVTKIMENYINAYATKMMKVASNSTSKNKVARVRYLFIILNKLEDENANIDEIIKTANLFKNPEQVIANIKDNRKSYRASYRRFFNRINTQKFKIEYKEINNPNENIYSTAVVSTLKFSKLFSDYIIDRSYSDEVINEDMKLVQLKLLSTRILKDLLDVNYDKKYIISFPKSLFAKPKKMLAYLTCIDDFYSQSKIYILVTDEIIKESYKTLMQLKRQGFLFVVQTSTNEINTNENIKSFLYVFDFIFILDDNNNVDTKLNYDRIPTNLWNYIVKVDESLDKEVVVE